jgi:DNA-binding NtrC family response regulator
MKRPVVLIVDDQADARELLERLLEGAYDTLAAKDGPQAIEMVRSHCVDIVLMDVKLPGMDGLEALERIKEIRPEQMVIMLSATDSAVKAVASLKRGACNYIAKSCDSDEILSIINECFLRCKLATEVADLTEELREEFKKKHVYAGIISRSPRMHRVFDMIEKVGETSSSVLITGESGTGKELVARAIQSMGHRGDKPFIAINCGAVPSELMESDFFGHEKGAFTGAIGFKIGKFEYADGGTIFLDEISALPMPLQAKLLRVLQEKSFERVGSHTPIKVDVRIIAATNIDLEVAVNKGAFRADLYYRLKVVPLELPPLRARKEDIPILANHFLKKHSEICSKPINGISSAAMQALSEYSWPGNVRELENLIERLVVLASPKSFITYDDLPAVVFCTEILGVEIFEETDLRNARKSFEKRYILNVLKQVNWNRSGAARHMKIHRNTLLQKMKSMGIKGPKRTLR